MHGLFACIVISVVLLEQSCLVTCKKKEEKKNSKEQKEPLYTLQRSQKPVSEVSLSSGLKLSFTDKRSAGTLERWARELDNSGGTVTHNQAVYREQEVGMNRAKKPIILVLLCCLLKQGFFPYSAGGPRCRVRTMESTSVCGLSAHGGGNRKCRFSPIALGIRHWDGYNGHGVWKVDSRQAARSGTGV